MRAVSRREGKHKVCTQQIWKQNIEAKRTTVCVRHKKDTTTVLKRGDIQRAEALSRSLHSRKTPHPSMIMASNYDSALLSPE